MYSKITWLISLLLSLAACSADPGKTFFVSKWQSMNDPGLVIEFDENNEFILYRNAQNFSATMLQESCYYSIQRQSKNWYSFNTRNSMGEATPYKGRIEIISGERIRIYITKHHDILDLADEFYRTTDLHSYHKIMDQFPANE